VAAFWGGSFGGVRAVGLPWTRPSAYPAATLHLGYPTPMSAWERCRVVCLDFWCRVGRGEVQGRLDFGLPYTRLARRRCRVARTWAYPAPATPPRGAG
jgi:hypothetical protein